MKMFCITLKPEHLSLIKNLNYLPVGLGNEKFSEEWYQDKVGFNISHKNPYYGEYTFHYWLWKNNNINLDSWIGFCQYRKFWINPNSEVKLESIEDFKGSILKNIPNEFDNFDVILVDEIFVNKFRFSKFIKHNFKKMIKAPHLFFFKTKRTIKFQFDMWHGEGNLDEAIKKLPISEKNDFKEFVNTKVSFNPQNMFICKDKNKLFSYYESLFPWLQECEKIFGFKMTNDYGLKRIYGFLAERYCSYWFKKYAKVTTLPFVFKDLGDYL